MSRQLKVLIVSDAYYPYPCGLSEYVHHLSCKLREHGHRVDIVAGSFGKEDAQYEAIRIGRAIYIPLNKSFAIVPVGFDVPSKMRLLIERSNYDVIHLNGPICPNLSYFALKYSNARNIATFHTSSEKVQGFGSAAIKVVFRKVYEKLDVKIAVSESARKTNEFYFPGTYRIVPPGVDIKRFTPQGQRFASMRGNTLLFVGRLDPRKGLDRLIKAFAVARQRISDAKLIVVGHGPLYGKYVKMVNRANLADCVCFEGLSPYEMIPKYFRSAAAYTSPAVGGESFGIVLIEAMASGTPVIASDIEGYNKVVDTGRNGLLVNTADPQVYAGTIVNLLRDARLRKRFVKEGLRDVITKYSWDVIARKIEKYYYA